MCVYMSNSAINLSNSSLISALNNKADIELENSSKAAAIESLANSAATTANAASKVANAAVDLIEVQMPLRVSKNGDTINGNLVINGDCTVTGTINATVSGTTENATKATQDSNGDVIVDTYLKKNQNSEITGTLTIKDDLTIKTDFTDGESLYSTNLEKYSSIAFVNSSNTKWLSWFESTQTPGWQGARVAASCGDSEYSILDIGVDKTLTPVVHTNAKRFHVDGSIIASNGRMSMDRMDSDTYDHYRIYDPILNKGIWFDFGRFDTQWSRVITEHDDICNFTNYTDWACTWDGTYIAPSNGYIYLRVHNGYGTDGVYNLEIYKPDLTYLYSAGSSVTNGSVVGVFIPVKKDYRIVPRSTRTDPQYFRFFY